MIVVGNGQIGKTSMTKRFCKGAYSDEYKKTIGVDFLEKTHYVADLGDDVRFLVWDTAGQEEFDTITRTYVPPPARNTHAHTHAQGKEINSH